MQVFIVFHCFRISIVSEAVVLGDTPKCPSNLILEKIGHLSLCCKHSSGHLGHHDSAGYRTPGNLGFDYNLNGGSHAYTSLGLSRPSALYDYDVMNRNRRNGNT